MAQGSSSNNPKVVPAAANALDQLKYEVASDLGIHPNGNYWGDLPARACGAVGGHMVKRMIAMAEETLARQTQ